MSLRKVSPGMCDNDSQTRVNLVMIWQSMNILRSCKISSKQVSLTQTHQNIWMGSVIQRQTLIPAKMPNIFPGWWFDDAFPILLHHFQVPRYFLSMAGGCFFSAYLLYYPNTSQVLNCQGVTLSIVP